MSLESKTVDRIAGESVERVGALLWEGLAANATSWEVLSLAGLYWRVQGHAPRALDCFRATLYFAPHRMTPVPLVSIASILHR